jgi:hypothetical protein
MMGFQESESKVKWDKTGDFWLPMTPLKNRDTAKATEKKRDKSIVRDWVLGLLTL